MSNNRNRNRRPRPPVQHTDNAPRWSTSEALVHYAPRESVFWIDDDEYTFPVQAPLAFALEYIRLASEVSVAAAAAYGSEKLLGAEAFKRFMAWEGLTPDHIRFLFQAADKKLLGTADPKAPSETTPTGQGSQTSSG